MIWILFLFVSNLLTARSNTFYGFTNVNSYRICKPFAQPLEQVYLYSVPEKDKFMVNFDENNLIFLFLDRSSIKLIYFNMRNVTERNSF